MHEFGDSFLANLPIPQSAEAVVAIALALDEAAERRYSNFARELRAFGPPAVMSLLEELGGEHSARAGRRRAALTSGQHRDSAPEELVQLLPQVFSDDDAATCDRFGLTPYRVLAFAVGLALQNFKLYSYLAASAEDEVRFQAERLAGDELTRAARLRVRRRQAYHTGGAQREAEAYPSAGLVESRADLLAAALAIEHRLAQRLASEKETGFSAVRHATRQGIETLRQESARAGEPSRPMAEKLAAFSHSTWAKTLAGEERATGRQRVSADCERAFTFYDAVASAPADETVMLEAQDLSQAALERIQQVRAVADASDQTAPSN